MPKNKQKEEKTGLFSGVFAAYAILLFHVLLMAVVGCVVIFFRGIVSYLAWIMAGAALLIILSGVLIYRRVKREKQALGEMMDSPVFRGRAVEVSFLGGLASVRVGGAPETGAHALGNELESRMNPPSLQLEDPLTLRMRELENLARLMEKNLITTEEYNQTKARIFQSMESL